MKTLGLISDTHIPSRRKELPSGIYSAFENVDMILHAGDFEGLEVADALEEIAPLVAVHGNMCHWDVKQKYPSKLIFKVEDITIGLTHGSGGPSGYISRIQEQFSSDEYFPDIIVSGHSHNAKAEIIDDVLFLNPGSPTDKRFASQNTILILKVKKSNYEYKFLEL